MKIWYCFTWQFFILFCSVIQVIISDRIWCMFHETNVRKSIWSDKILNITCFGSLSGHLHILLKISAAHRNILGLNKHKTDINSGTHISSTVLNTFQIKTKITRITYKMALSNSAWRLEKRPQNALWKDIIRNGTFSSRDWQASKLNKILQRMGT